MGVNSCNTVSNLSSYYWTKLSRETFFIFNKEFNIFFNFIIIPATHSRFLRASIIFIFFYYFSAGTTCRICEDQIGTLGPPRDLSLGLRPQTESWLILILHFFEKYTSNLPSWWNNFQYFFIHNKLCHIKNVKKNIIET